MTIVELPDRGGYADVLTDGHLVAMIWVEPGKFRIWQTDPCTTNKWIMRTDNYDFIYADAIRRK